LPPGGTAAVHFPSALTYLSLIFQEIYVFGMADNGHLVVNSWNGSHWYWTDQGLP